VLIGEVLIGEVPIGEVPIGEVPIGEVPLWAATAGPGVTTVIAGEWSVAQAVVAAKMPAAAGARTA